MHNECHFGRSATYFIMKIFGMCKGQHDHCFKKDQKSNQKLESKMYVLYFSLFSKAEENEKGKWEENLRKTLNPFH